MAQKKIIVYTDDLTGAESSEVGPHSFSLDGVNYGIDLTPESYDLLFEALAPFIKAGRKEGRAKARPRRPGSGDDAMPGRIRAWALANGLQVSQRGRVPASVREAYEAAH